MKKVKRYISKIILINLVGIFVVISAVKAQEKPEYFPPVENWTLSENIDVYSPETLYDAINGAADSYLRYDFRELKVGEYSLDDGTYLVVEIYQHGSPINAFGIYSQERPQKGNYIEVGAQGYKETGVLNFVTGDYYIKISSHDSKEKTQEAIFSIANRMTKNLGDNKSLPKILNIFPQDGKVENSEQYISIDFLGHRFLNSAFKSDYKLDKDDFSLFIITKANSDECRIMLESYLEFAKLPATELKEGLLSIPDKYYGEVKLYWKDNYILGILEPNNVDPQIDYFEILLKGLKKHGEI